MAFNVHLALFRGWTAKRMRAQEWKYFLGCYGCSFLPALAYLFVNTKGRGKIYGPALVRTMLITLWALLIFLQLWCWIDTRWDFLRVATLYGIVWYSDPLLVR